MLQECWKVRRVIGIGEDAVVREVAIKIVEYLARRRRGAERSRNLVERVVREGVRRGVFGEERKTTRRDASERVVLVGEAPEQRATRRAPCYVRHAVHGVMQTFRKAAKNA